jgi:Tol biopolymer transport system component
MRANRRDLGFAILVLALVVAGPVATNASAQYFGRNKVQYRNLDFKVLKTDHFDVYFYPEERDAAVEASRMAERWYARFAAIFQHQLSGRQPLILYASHADFEQTNAIEGLLGEGTGGVTEPLKRRIVLPLAPSLAETNHVIGHELVHAFQYDITGGSARRGEGLEGMNRLPLWFIEGMAEYLSLGPDDPNTAMWIRDAAGQEKLPDIDKLNDPKYFPYRWGQAFWAYVTGRWGDDVVRQLLVEGGDDGDVKAAIKHVLKVDTKELSKDWHAAIYDEYGPFQKATKNAAAYGQLLITGREPGGDINVTPSLSPDGRRLLFFSARDLFSIDLYLADATNGHVLHRVVKTAFDPHFSSLQFIDSAGAWSPDGHRVAIGAVSQGRAEIALFDVDKLAIAKEIPFPTIDTILNPSWSKDGRYLAFTGTVGALSDLFVYDLKQQSLKRLTRDAYTDLQPAWSPDGRRIAFVTDRFSTDLTDLAMGNYRLALIDPTTGDIQPVSTFDQGKNTNPQWSPDGRALYFLSDRNGVTNVYKLEIGQRLVSQVTDLFTGVSGITALSPALSVAADEDHAVVSVYEHGRYDIYALTQPRVLTGEPPTPAASEIPERLPPVNRLKEQLLTLLASPTKGLPEASHKVAPYSAHLSLDAVGQPSLTAGVDPFGTFVGGGLAFSWSDMLGNHDLLAAVQTGSYFGGGFSDVLNNTAVAVGYLNRTHRWNWGGVVQQFPYLSGAFAQGVADVNGSPAVVQETTVFRQVNRGVSAITSYPFNQSRRIEFSGGIQRISFDQEVNTQIYDYNTGALVSNQTQTVPLADTLNLGQASAALVYDTSAFGATSPVAGERYRLEVSPTVGSIQYTDVLADYRRYFEPAKLYTIAARVMHFGRYGSGSEDPRLYPLFIGYPELVRGYDIGTFSASECHPNATSSCPEFDRLIGSRMLVSNLELRFPLLRPFGIRENVYGPLPMELAFFADAGVAWDSQDTPTFFGGTRQAVSSAGAALRVNVFNFAVAEFDLSHPFQRPGKGWVFQFNLSPGF